MQKGHVLEFNCIGCQTPVQFSLFEIEHHGEPIGCCRCGKKYLFNDDTLQRHLKKFEALCCQIRESEEILGNTSVAINVGNHQVEVPYRLLLTRLSSKIHLKIGEEQVSIAFRLEPINDVPTKDTPNSNKDEKNCASGITCVRNK